jgi:glycosyltransferase involved in cell wall biosynthesis
MNVRRLRVAFVCEPWDTVDPPPSNYSGPILTFEIARRLSKHCDVVVYSHKRAHLPNVQHFESVEYRYQRLFAERRGAYRFTHLGPIKAIIQKYNNLLYPNFDRPSFTSSFAYWTYILPIVMDTRSKQIDVVHIHQFSQFVPIVRALNPHTKIVLHMHTDWLNQLDRNMLEQRIKKTDLILGCSDFIGENVRKRFPEYAGKCSYLHNGANINSCSDERQGSNQNRKRILFVGRVSPEKGVHILIDAFKSVLLKHPNSELLIVGPQKSASRRFIVDFSDDPIVSRLAQFYNGGSYQQHLESKITSEISDRIRFIGAVEFQKLNDFYRSSDIVIMPSVWQEPFGMPIVEAMASSCAVIATRGGGFLEIVEDGKTGLLVERDNVHSLSEAIIRLLDDDEFRVKIAAAGRQRAVEQFSWDKIANDLLEKYQQLTNIAVPPSV